MQKSKIIVFIIVIMLIIVGIVFIPKVINYRFLNGMEQMTGSISESKTLGLFLKEFKVSKEKSNLRFLKDIRFEDIWLENYADFSNDYRFPKIDTSRIRLCLKMDAEVLKDRTIWYLDGLSLREECSDIWYMRSTIWESRYYKLKNDTVYIRVLKDGLPRSTSQLEFGKSKNISEIGLIVLVQK